MSRSYSWDTVATHKGKKQYYFYDIVTKCIISFPQEEYSLFLSLNLKVFWINYDSI